MDEVEVKFDDHRHQSLSNYFSNVGKTGKLGNGVVESPHKPNLFKALIQSFPTDMIVLQAFWSSIVIIISYFIGKDNAEASSSSGHTLSIPFWTSRLNVSVPVTGSVGWALFVLLGFYVREASYRYIDGQKSIYRAGSYLLRVTRMIRQVFPKGSWHEGDRDRILAHLIAYPLALKMMLRNERDIELLKMVLHEDDARDVINSRSMHFHCMRVVKSYLIVADEQFEDFKKYNSVKRTHPGLLTRMEIGIITDAVDEASIKAFRLSQYRPSIAYLNHLKIFLIIWMLFVPLSLVKTSGWFTILWSLIVTYAAATLTLIAKSLERPFGVDETDIKLNAMCSEMANNILKDGYSTKLEYIDVIDEFHETPNYLNEILRNENKNESTNDMVEKINRKHKIEENIKKYSIQHILDKFNPLKSFYFQLLIYSLWCAFIVVLSWSLRYDDPPTTTRWWRIYIPLNISSTTFMSLCVSLLLGFWMDDSYRRYWTALQVWKTKLQPMILQYAFQLTACPKRGNWHQRDRERILSLMMAFPYTLKQHLRKSRDLHELESILSPKDISSIKNSRNMPSHVLSIIYAYIRSTDKIHLKGTEYFKIPIVMEPNNFLKLEDVIVECDEIQKFIISPQFQLHLNIISWLWLLMLPLSIISSAGWVSFLYLIPIGYSILKLLRIGHHLSDPFGEDRSDLELESFCEEIKQSVLIYYKDINTGKDLRYYVRASSKYNRNNFMPKPYPKLQEKIKSAHREHHIVLNPSFIFKKISDVIPQVPLYIVLASLLWSVSAVFISWGLSKLWIDEQRNACKFWCSPVDVPGKILENIGYALFLILAFRVSDAVSRYDEGVSIFTEMKLHLRTFSMEMIQFIKDGTFHENDKERVIAHVLQIPLLFNDMLLNTYNLTKPEYTFLDEKDFELFEASEDKMEYLLKTIESYFLNQTVKNIGHDYQPLNVKKMPTLNQLIFTASGRCATIRNLIAKALTVKKFPIVESYKQHQTLFAAVWIIFLPWEMTQSTGWLTILWSFVISFTVISMQQLAIQLVDPYDDDYHDLPVTKLCQEINTTVIDAVNNSNWEIDELVHESVNHQNAGLGSVIEGNNLYHKFMVPSLEVEEINESKTSEEINEDIDNENISKDPYTAVKISDEEDEIIYFSSPRQKITKKSIIAHFIHSVPWWLLLFILAWTTLAVAISYGARDRSMDGKTRWWESFISLSADIGKYISVGTFSILGFYVRIAFGRYNASGKVWGDQLQRSLHKLTTSFINFFPENELHRGDHQRIIGHLLALPIVLKEDLRDSRDIRQLKGLLSSSDISRLLYATSMSSTCMDVIRAYFYKVMSRRNTIQSKKVNPGLVFVPIWLETKALETTIEMVKRFKLFKIAPSCTILLRFLLGVWFIILPFILAEESGWFTILWVPIVSYGIVGLYSISHELQNPFGSYINNLDLDHLVDDIITDIVQVFKISKKVEKEETSQLSLSENTKENIEDTIDNINYTIWKSPGLSQEKSIFSEQDELTAFQIMIQRLRLFAHPVPVWYLFLVASWSTIAIYIAYLTSVNLPQFGKNTTCHPWFCSAISVESNLQTYFGWALFLLLGFRMNDSHNRFVQAIVIWQERVVGYSRLIAQRLYGSHGERDWLKEGYGKEYVGGYISSYSVCLMGSLRKMDYVEKLKKVTSDKQINKIMKMKRRCDFCMDEMLKYILAGEPRIGKHEGVSIAKLELMTVFINWSKLYATANDCEVMQRIPMPYGYIVHLRVFLIIWLVILPLSLVESNGWLSILWITIISYGVIGVEKWANELSDPFGSDLSDIPLERLCTLAVNSVKNEFNMYQNGIGQFVVSDRPPFMEIEKNSSEEKIDSTSNSSLPQDIV